MKGYCSCGVEIDEVQFAQFGKCEKCGRINKDETIKSSGGEKTVISGSKLKLESDISCEPERETGYNDLTDSKLSEPYALCKKCDNFQILTEGEGNPYPDCKKIELLTNEDLKNPNKCSQYKYLPPKESFDDDIFDSGLELEEEYK